MTGENPRARELYIWMLWRHVIERMSKKDVPVGLQRIPRAA